MTPSLSTKAETLAALQGRLRSAWIPPLSFFSLVDWRADPQACLDKIRQTLGDGPFAVRSSCRAEDSETASNAGAFLSLLDVSCKDLPQAIEQVFASYGIPSGRDQILIQTMVVGVLSSGVAFSHDPNTRAPYRVINWSDGTDTTAVTGGAGGRAWHHAAASPVAPASALSPILALLEELLDLFNQRPLDCEFAVVRTPEGEQQVILLQVRPLIMTGPVQTVEKQAEILKRIEDKVARGMGPHPFLMGKKTVYGIMPDWNPAEMIGIRPQPLALSLYRELITDAIWAYQRHNYGYRNLRSFPLMPHFHGLPYIDVRVSFNSFIPADLEPSLAGRLVDYYITRLLNEPALHDKVEFEIVYSCYTLDLPSRLENLAEAGFSTHDRQAIADSLRALTNRIANPKTGLWQIDAEKLKKLQARREQLYASDTDPLERIYWLLEDGKRYGTLPFAGLARAGFIAVQMLRSLVAIGALSEADYDAFMGSLSTVSGQLSRDREMLPKSSFLARYGHLRPGTYDILSPRYDEAADLFFDWSKPSTKPERAPSFSLTLGQMRRVSDALAEHGLNADVVGLFDFIEAGIALREQAKFDFSRNLSDVLVLAAQVGADYGFSREDISFVDIGVFKELHVGAADARALLARAVEDGRERHAITQTLALPPVIANPQDVWSFEWPKTIPNFITQKQVAAPVCGCQDGESMDGKIVCIPSADPGYDWVFSHPIAGLITAWGGVNSHMAIRAGELGLPAVIGAGQTMYQLWSEAECLRIDCASRRVDILS